MNSLITVMHILQPKRIGYLNLKLRISILYYMTICWSVVYHPKIGQKARHLPGPQYHKYRSGIAQGSNIRGSEECLWWTKTTRRFESSNNQ